MIVLFVSRLLLIIVPIALVCAIFGSIIYGVIVATPWLFETIYQHYEIVFIGLIIATFIYLSILAARKIGWKHIIVIYLILSALRLGLYFWVDPIFMTKSFLTLLGMLGMGTLLYYLFSRNWKKIKFSKTDRKNFIVSLLGLLGFISFFTLIFFFLLFSATFLPKVENTTVVNAVATVTKEKTDPIFEPVAETFVFRNGNSIWGFLQEQGIEKDSLLIQSIRISNSNDLKSFVIDKNDNKIWVTKMESDSLKTFYEKNGKNYVTLVPRGTNASWYQETKKLVID